MYILEDWKYIEHTSIDIEHIYRCILNMYIYRWGIRA